MTLSNRISEVGNIQISIFKILVYILMRVETSKSTLSEIIITTILV